MESEYAIEIENVVKKYGELTAVNGISFKIKKGEIFAFLGQNGAGKTTTVEIIEGVRKPTSGKVTVLGLNVLKNHDLNEIKKIIGTLPQDFSTHGELTVLENIRYWCRLYDKSIPAYELIKLVKLRDKEKAKFKHLSGGLKKRVGIAIALVNDPKIIFLDEPTTGLDPKARRDTWEIIRGFKEQGKTIFLTTHFMEEAQVLADTVAIIHKGNIVAMGTPSSLIDQFGGDNKIIIRCPNQKSRDQIFKFLVEYGPIENKDKDIIISTKNLKIHKIIDLFEKEKIEYTDIITQRPSLEDVFLSLTGETLISETEEHI